MSKKNEEYQKIFNEKMKVWVNFPLVFIEDMWGLVPQPVLKEHKQAYQMCIDQQAWDAVQHTWFEPFQRGKHLTWQQSLILHAICAK